jgi:hypothetical protein
MNKSAPTSVTLKWVTDPEELAKSRVQDERFERNWQWFKAHAAEIYPRYRGKCLCIAGQELFVADTPKEAVALATAAHPDDNGWFTRYIPREKGARIYAHRRRVAHVR